MKNTNKIKVLLSGCILFGNALLAQVGGTPPGSATSDPAVVGGAARIVTDEWQPSLRRDGAIDRIEHNNMLTPWQPIREADVLYRKKVWSEIDTRLKQNMAFRYPGDEETGGGMYIEILIDAIKKGDVVAFSDERFTIPLSSEDVMNKLAGKSDTQRVEDPITGEIKEIVTVRRFDPELITKFRIKEEKIFDKNIGRMVNRIIGISPYMDKLNTDGSYRASVPLFWLYYPDIRPVNVKYEVYNPENDVFRITWDDFFEKRMFASTIYKTNINNYLQEDIKAYKSGVDALNASEEIKEKLFNKEHDLWVY